MSTITNYTNYIVYESPLGKRVLIKPFSVIRYKTNHITLSDAFNNQYVINADDLTGFSYSGLYDLINQLLILSINSDNLTTVDLYSDLPDPTTLPNRFFFVRLAQGTKWLPGTYGGTYYPNGTYYSDGTQWIAGVDIYTSIQKITGTVTLANPPSNPETGLSKEATQLQVKLKTDNIPAQGQALAAGSTPIVLTAIQISTLTPLAQITGFATSAKQDSLLAELQLKADLTETQPVSVSTLPLPLGAATEATQSGIATAVKAPVNARSISRFYNVRGQRYIATTGYVQQGLVAAGEVLALLKNPAGSGMVLMFDKAEFGATATARFSRFGGGTTPLIGSPTPRPVGRTDGGVSTSVMEFYNGGNLAPQFSVSVPGTLRKVATMLAYSTYQLLEMDGTAVLQPGQQVYWVVDESPGGGIGNFHTFIDLEWVEMPLANWNLMVTALQAKTEY